MQLRLLYLWGCLYHLSALVDGLINIGQTELHRRVEEFTQRFAGSVFSPVPQ